MGRPLHLAKKANKDFKTVYLPSKRIISRQRIHAKKITDKGRLVPRMFIIRVLCVIAKYFKNLNVH